MVKVIFDGVQQTEYYSANVRGEKITHKPIGYQRLQESNHTEISTTHLRLF